MRINDCCFKIDYLDFDSRKYPGLISCILIFFLVNLLSNIKPTCFRILINQKHTDKNSRHLSTQSNHTRAALSLRGVLMLTDVWLVYIAREMPVYWAPPRVPIRREYPLVCCCLSWAIKCRELDLPLLANASHIGDCIPTINPRIYFTKDVNCLNGLLVKSLIKLSQHALGVGWNILGWHWNWI